MYGSLKQLNSRGHYKSRLVLGEIWASLSQRHNKSRRVLVEISLISTRSLSSRWDLVAISETTNLAEIAVSSTRSRQDLCDNTNLAEVSVKFLHGLCFAFLFLFCFIRAKLPNAGKKIKTVPYQITLHPSTEYIILTFYNLCKPNWVEFIPRFSWKPSFLATKI